MQLSSMTARQIATFKMMKDQLVFRVSTLLTLILLILTIYTDVSLAMKLLQLTFLEFKLATFNLDNTIVSNDFDSGVCIHS